MEADSSGYAIGGIISQVDEKGRLRPVGFCSRKLTPAEANYQIHDKELLSIVATLRHFRGELRSVERPFIAFSDHRNLRYFMTTRQLLERQVRWAKELSSFNFETFAGLPNLPRTSFPWSFLFYALQHMISGCASSCLRA